jgi:hypothetical protein
MVVVFQLGTSASRKSIGVESCHPDGLATTTRKASDEVLQTGGKRKKRWRVWRLQEIEGGILHRSVATRPGPVAELPAPS